MRLRDVAAVSFYQREESLLEPWRVTRMPPLTASGGDAVVARRWSSVFSSDEARRDDTEGDRRADANAAAALPESCLGDTGGDRGGGVVRNGVVCMENGGGLLIAGAAYENALLCEEACASGATGAS